jgi:hypothetical protein
MITLLKIDAGELGLEPRLTASKAAVLPLDDSPILLLLYSNLMLKK